jgi:predicted nucleic acid-binding protein
VIYWDTSCLLKLYTDESDSMKWEHLALTVEDEFASSALVDVEMACALEHKESRREIRSGASKALLALFRKDVRLGRFALYPVGSDVLVRASEMAAVCRRAREPFVLRALDAIHLATAETLKCAAIASTDRRLRDGASLLDMRLL